MAHGYNNIEFLGRVNDEYKAELFSKCLAFLNPQEEDFGISKVEAMASGRPVIAYKKGGALETVIEGKTGMFFTEQTVESLSEVVQKFYTEMKGGQTEWNSYEIREHAKQFSLDNFKENIKNFIEQVQNKDKI
jgi:glycosyltransferase involved in cell wall biosynthesis